MRKTWKQFIFTGLTCLLIVAGSAGRGWTESQTKNSAGSTNLQQRIDFGNAYIMGQSIKSGAVYLLHRKQSDISSMLQYRKDYRQEILEDFNVQDHEMENSQVKARNSEVFRK
jgi:hypothetical protein